MILMKGSEVSKNIKDNVKGEIDYIRYGNLNAKIKLAVVSVGNDAASSVYIRNKKKVCEYVGIEFVEFDMPETTTQKALEAIVDCLNNDSSITGILVQLPLPKHIDEKRIASLISPEKDVDGFNPVNVGNLSIGGKCIAPCTPNGIINMLDYYGIEIAGKNCVVVGRSNIVGKPMSMMLLNKDGTVTTCHSKTENLKRICRKADILVCAIGKPKFFDDKFVKDGAVVVDVGIHKMDDGSMCGDVDFDSVKDIVYAITPVPGGVGMMTTAMLASNCLKAYRLQDNTE